MSAADRAASDPHGDQPVRWAGEPLPRAEAAAILIHGRGATAESILSLAAEVDVPGFAYLAPQARDRTWYGHSFLAPLEDNEPGLSSGLRRLAALVEELEAAGLPAERVVLLGFSQGACLALEFAARHARRYGAVVGFTGGLVGPPGTPRRYPGSLDGSPVFLGAGDPDPHVPWWRVQETADLLTSMGAAVALRRYPGLPHTVNAEELELARDLLRRVAGGARRQASGDGGAEGT